MIKVSQYAIHGIITLKSGTRIGGSDDTLQIGGTDLTCIKDPVTECPYIPGSSIKGKIRSSLEKVHGAFRFDERSKDYVPDNREPCSCADKECPICRVFGPHKSTKHELGPTRIKVYDAPLISDLFKVEYKTESINRRDTGAAEHPRTSERVAPGAQFRLRIDIMEYDLDKNFSYTDVDGKTVTGRDALIAVVDHGIDLLETNGIGAGTGKGYGEITIDNIRCETLVRKRHIPAFTDGSQP